MLYILFCSFLSFCEGRKTAVPEAGKILLPWGRRTGKRIFPVHTCQPSEGAGSQDRSHILPDGSSLRGSWKIHPTGWFPVLFHILQNNTEGQSATVPNISYNLKSRLPFPESSPVSFSDFAYFCIQRMQCVSKRAKRADKSTEESAKYHSVETNHQKHRHKRCHSNLLTCSYLGKNVFYPRKCCGIDRWNKYEIKKLNQCPQPGMYFFSFFRC